AQDLLEAADNIAKLQQSRKPHSIVDPRKDGSGSQTEKDMTWKACSQKYFITWEENVLPSLNGRLAAEANCLCHSPPNRTKRLVTEASEIETSLPPNIYVKIDEVRPSLKKSLVVRPEGTLYEAGLFDCAFTLFALELEENNSLMVLVHP
ncbi:hypothetical protein MMC22_010067, partial [Lobaria immixta]|nr:hypothetical protein [Lobaria immixta]